MATTAVKERAIPFRGREVRAILDGRKTQFRRVVRPQPHESCDPDGTGFHWHPDGQEGWYLWGHEAGVLADQMARHSRCPWRLGDRLAVQESLWVSDCGQYFARETHRPHEVMREVLARDGTRRWRVRDGEPMGEGDYTDTVIGWGNQGRNVGRGGRRRWVSAFDQSFVGGIEPATPEHPYGKTVDRRDAVFRRRLAATQMPRWASRITLEVVERRVQRLQEISEEDAIAEGSPLVSGSYGHRTWFRELWNEAHGKRPGCSWVNDPWVWAITFRRVEEGKYDR